MRHLKITLAYDGTGFHGWQVQPGLATIQGAVEAVLAELEGAPVKIHGAGRTDAGVHALAQTASFSFANPIPLVNLRQAMNRLLPDAIRVLGVEEVPSTFHARHSATGKFYEYRIWRTEICPPVVCRYVHSYPYPLDEDRMAGAASRFVGRHDFRSFAASSRPEMESTVRTVFVSRMEREGDLLVYRVRGEGFLYNMVRNIVGTLIDVGRGRLAPDDIDQILAARERSAAGPTAPAKGLYLVEVLY